MSERANFVIIRDGKARILYESWGALGCVQYLVGGPNAATASAENASEMGGLMPPHADGGYLVDHDTRTLIVIARTEPDAFVYPEWAWPDDELSENSKAARIERLFRRLAPQWMLCYDHRNTHGFAAHLCGRGIPLLPMPHPRDPYKTFVPSPLYAHGCMDCFQA